MVRKTIPTARTEELRRDIMDESDNPTLIGLARSIVDIQERDGHISIAMVHAKHVEMLVPYHDELAEILSTQGITVTNLSMLETVHRYGWDYICQLKDPN